MKRKAIYLSFIFLWFLSLGSHAFAESGPPEATLSASELLALYKSMYSPIHNMKVSYTNAVEEAHPDPNTPNASNSSIRYYKVRRIEEGDKYFTSFSYSTAPNDFGKSDERLNEYTFDGKVSMEYCPEEKSGSIIPGRTGTMYETINHLLDYMMINKVAFGNESKLRITLSVDPQGKVRPQLEKIGGQWCHVVESIRPPLPYEPNTGGITIWFAADKGGLPMKFEEHDGFGKCVKKIVVEKTAATDNGGSKLWYPQEAIMTDRFVERTVEQRFVCHELKVNIETNENTWKINFPEGTQVVDRVNGLVYRADSSK
jgi:hypothetical protein